MDKIIDNLYLGDIRAAANLFLLKQHVRYFILFHYHKTTPVAHHLSAGSYSHPPSSSWPQPLLPLSK